MTENEEKESQVTIEETAEASEAVQVGADGNVAPDADEVSDADGGSEADGDFVAADADEASDAEADGDVVAAVADEASDAEADGDVGAPKDATASDADEASDADADGDVGAPKDASASDADEASDAGASDDDRKDVTKRTDVTFELRQLLEYTSKYSEIGPTVAELCIKLGHRELGERILRMGQGEGRSMEYFFVAGDVARREGRPDDVLQIVLDALDAFRESAAEEMEEDDASRLLHLVRLGFAALMFDIEDVNARPEWTKALAEKLEAVRPRYEKDAFFHTLFAQALWFDEREKSEKIWDEAAQLDDPESTWNARGTWYKESETDLAKAESAYRKGLEASSSSALLMHNLAQVLLDRAGQDDADPIAAAGWVKEADGLLYKALKRVHRRGLRRHIHLTVDRMKKMRPAIEEEAQVEAAPEVGDIVEGKVENITHYGAFISIAPGVTGLMHKSEIAHDYVEKPGDYVKKGETLKVKVIDIQNRDDEQGIRIGLSRKALLEKKEGGGGGRKKSGGDGGKNKGRKRDSNKRSSRNDNRGSKPSSDKLATLGELLLAKMEDKEKG